MLRCSYMPRGLYIDVFSLFSCIKSPHIWQRVNGKGLELSSASKQSEAPYISMRDACTYFHSREANLRRAMQSAPCII